MTEIGLPSNTQRAPLARRGYTGSEFASAVFKEHGQDGKAVAFPAAGGLLLAGLPILGPRFASLMVFEGKFESFLFKHGKVPHKKSPRKRPRLSVLPQGESLILQSRRPQIKQEEYFHGRIPRQGIPTPH
jgi:hypothetical protein